MSLMSYLCKIGRLHKLKLIGNLAVSLLTPFLLACKTFYGVQTAVSHVFHFENNSKIAA